MRRCFLLRLTVLFAVGGVETLGCVSCTSGSKGSNPGDFPRTFLLSVRNKRIRKYQTLLMKKELYSNAREAIIVCIASEGIVLMRSIILTSPYQVLVTVTLCPLGAVMMASSVRRSQKGRGRGGLDGLFVAIRGLKEGLPCVPRQSTTPRGSLSWTHFSTSFGTDNCVASFMAWKHFPHTS